MYRKISGLDINELKVGACTFHQLPTTSRHLGYHASRVIKCPVDSLMCARLQVLEKNMIEALNYNVDVSPQELFDYGRKTVGWRKQEMFRPENP
jgi:hypothetical protein